MTRWTPKSITKSISEALGSHGPRAESRRAPGIHKSHLRYICYPYWKPNLGIRLQPQSYSSMCFPHGCFCTRSECIRTGSERRIRNPAKDQSRFGIVNSKSNSMASLLLTKIHMVDCGHFPGPFLMCFLFVLSFRTYLGDLGFRGWFSACEKEAGPAMEELNIPKHPGSRTRFI